MKTKVILSILLFIGMIKSVSAQDSWTQIADFRGGARYGATGIGIGDKGYVGLGITDAGYQQDFWEYNPATNAWTQKADFPGGARVAATGFTIGNKGYIGTGAHTVGDYDWTWYNDLWEYNPQLNTWTRKADMGGIGRYTAVGFSIGNKGYIGTGNYRKNRSYPAVYQYDFWEYDPSTDTWAQKANVPTQGRSSAIGLSIGNKGYIGLGFFYYDTRKNDFWEYDPASNTWTQKANFAGTPRYAAEAFSIGTKGFVGAGYNTTSLSDMWEYNPADNTWSRKADFGGSFSTQGVGFSIGEKGYLGTGYNNSQTLSAMWQYTPILIPTRLTCPSDTAAVTGTSSCEATVMGIDPIIDVGNINTDVDYTLLSNGSYLSSGTGSASGLVFQKGITTVMYRVHNNGALRCQFTVSVMDTLKPVIACLPPIILCHDSLEKYTIPPLQATDNCGVQSYRYIITGATDRSGTGQDASGYFYTGISYINWTVTDLSGNQSTCQTAVTTDSKINVNIPSSFPVWPGGKPNTLYIGYGPATLTLTPNVSGGVPFAGNNYNYNWSTGASSKSITVNPATPGNYVYYLTVTDSYGCEVNTSTTVTVIDVRCGNKLDKVAICLNHPSNGEKLNSICISANAVNAHLKKGALLGDCNDVIEHYDSMNLNPGGSLLSEIESEILVYPNPTSGIFTVQVNDLTSSFIDIKVIDSFGGIVGQRTIQGLTEPQNVVMDLPYSIPSGLYTIRISSNDKLRTFKIMVQK